MRSSLAGEDSNLYLTAPKAAVLPLHHPPLLGCSRHRIGLRLSGFSRSCHPRPGALSRR
jgi:hypothetical protein